MTQKQLSRYLVIEYSLEGGISVKKAAEVLGLSARQVIRLRNEMKEQGVSTLIHKNQGRQLLTRAAIQAPPQAKRFRIATGNPN